MFVFGLLRVGNGVFSLEGENRRHLGSRLVESQPFPDPPLYTHEDVRMRASSRAPLRRFSLPSSIRDANIDEDR
jgi:hypothetical protein